MTSFFSSFFSWLTFSFSYVSLNSFIHSLRRQWIPQFCCLVLSNSLVKPRIILPLLAIWQSCFWHLVSVQPEIFFCYSFHLHALVLLSHCFHVPYRLCTLNLDAVLNLAFALSLLCFVVMHASLVSSNTTSVEVINTMFTFCFPDFGYVNSLLHSDTYVSL